MLNISIQKIFLRESEMSLSTEDQELYSRDSKFQTGQLPITWTAGKLMLIQDKHGITQWQTCTPNSHHNLSSEKDKNQMFSNGSDLNNLVKDLHQDSSSMKFHTHGGTETEVISIIQKTLFIHSHMLIKNLKLTLVLIPQLQKEENNGRENTLQFLHMLQKSYQWLTLFSFMKFQSSLLKNHISKESGSPINNKL